MIPEVDFAGFHPDPASVSPQALAGRYRFTHDGWLGTLTLECAGDREFVGSYHDDRFQDDFTVQATIGVPEPHRVDLVVREFNWMPEQRFEGWLFTQGKNGLAGWTTWLGTPYGFFARKTGLLNLATYRPGRIQLSDLLGTYRVAQDGVSAELELAERRPDSVQGWYWLDRSQPPLLARATLGGPAPHAVQITVLAAEGPSPVLVMKGYLFSRQKSAVAGWVEWQGQRYGCYLVRIA